MLIKEKNQKRTSYAEAQSWVTSFQGYLVHNPFGFGVAVHLAVQTKQRRHFSDHTIRIVDRFLFGGWRPVEFFHSVQHPDISRMTSGEGGGRESALLHEPQKTLTSDLPILGNQLFFFLCIFIFLRHRTCTRTHTHTYELTLTNESPPTYPISLSDGTRTPSVARVHVC